MQIKTPNLMNLFNLSQQFTRRLNIITPFLYVSSSKKSCSLSVLVTSSTASFNNNSRLTNEFGSIDGRHCSTLSSVSLYSKRKSPVSHLPITYSTENNYSSTFLGKPSKIKLNKMMKAEKNDSKVKSAHNSQSAILRYCLGEERFQFKLILRNGKVFNFDRSVADPCQSFVERMSTNITKKVKSFDGQIKLLNSFSEDGKKEEEYVVDGSLKIEDLLQELLNGSKQLNVQVGEEIYDVALNPPEIFGVKFLKSAKSGFPILPYKIEASSNFNGDSSKYIWEYTKQEVSSKPKSDKKRKNSLEAKAVDNSLWANTGCKNLVFIPGEDLVGSRIRFTCVPSDGSCFGLPFSVELPAPIIPSTEETPLYEERVKRLNNSNQNDPNHFRVVSYNCLADTYATAEWFISSPPESLSAEFRLPFLLKELSSYCADIFCLQEIDEKYYEGIFSPFFKSVSGYNGNFTSKVGNTREGVATFYNPKKLDFLRNETIVILEHMKTLPFWNSISTISDQFLSRLVDRNTVLQVSIFKPKGCENTILLVANTHLYFHPDADHIRGLQTITCVNYIERTVEDIKKAFPQFQVALLFCGDFNCTPPFSSYRFLTTGKLEENDFDWSSHPSEKLLPGVQVTHSLKLQNSHPGEELTNITTCFEGCIDYVLYQPENFKLINSYPPPDKSLIASIIGVDETRKVSLPNWHTPSDHLPLISDFLLLPKS